MIVIYDAAGAKHPLSGYTNYHIRHMADGEDRLSFYLDTSHEQYQLIREEGKIEAEGNDYLVKKIDNNKIDCVLDFDFLKARTYTDYRSETRTLLDVLTDHLPEGWTIEGAEVSTIRRTISFDACTDYDIISQCQKTYSVRFIWHIQDKRLEVIDPDQITPTGEYITSELNLQSLSFKGETTSFATRLYAYGADGMTMEDAIVDGERYGKTYVENHEFSDKVVCAVWKDERYTIPANLFNDATEKLALLAKPVRSYKCRVLDLAKQDPRYSFLTFSMWRKITLIDVERKLRVEHQIVQYDEYPEEPDRNDVTLSCVPETIHDRIKATAAITEDGKAKIFVTQPTPPYDIGDLWAQGPDGEILSCRIRRAAGEAFDLDDWILASKYTDDTYAEAVQADLDQYKIDVSAILEVHEDNIEARVTKTGGESSSFAWILTDAAHTWYANSVPVMAVSKDGLTVNGNGTFTGEIRASKGYIGGATGFEITSQAIRNGMESRDDTGHNGVYIGTSGIALGGGKFKVTSTGAVTAKSLDLTGGSIRLGDDGNGNPVFAVTNQGAVTAKNLTLTGGSINIGDRFKVSTSGYLTADFTGGSITLGKDSSNNPIFQVTSGGVVTAKSLNLTGGSISLGNDGNGNPVFRVTSQGAVTAKNLTLTGGSINIGDKFKVSTAGVLTADMTGGSITLGDNFAVTNAGAVTAKNLTLTGGSISFGDDGQGKPVFQVTNQGAVTAKNLTLTGGSINIGDKFKVSTTGVLTADMTGGSITLGDNFAVTNQGAVTAKNLTLTGGSISLGSDTGGNPVFHVTNQGAVTAKNLTLTGGSINIGDKFKVSSAGVLTADMTGGSITLGNNFAVTNSGAVTAKDLTLTGGSISLGNDGSGNPVFNVTSSGAVTARNLALTGGSINIKDENGETAFSVSSTGAVTASKLSVTGGSISIGNAFSVDEEGNIRASSGYFGGSVLAENIKSDAVDGEGGSLSGSAISQQSIPANRVGNNVLTTGQFANGVNSSLGYANAYNSATQSGTGTYPQYFTAGNLYVRGGQILNEGDYLIKIASGGGYATYNLQVHTHQISADSSGKVTIGAADWTGTAHSFNIADTDFYRRAVSAITVKTVAELAHTTSSDKSVTVSDGNVRLIDGYLKGRILATLDNDNTSRIYVALKADKAYDAGAATVSVQGSSGLTITTKNAHKTSGSHHYVNVDVTPTAQTTKLDGTKVTATNTINRDINADTVYADGRSSVVVNGASAVSYGGDYDFNPTIANSRISYSGGYLYGAVNVTLDNSKTYTVYVKMDGTKAYDAGAASAPTPSYSITDGNVSADPNNPYDSSNPSVFYVKATFKVDGNSKSYTTWVNVNNVYQAGVTAGESSGAAGVSISGVSYSSYSTSADHSTTLDYSYVRYDSSTNRIKGRISVALSNGDSDTVFVEMDASRVPTRSISSVDQSSYSTSADFSVTFDDYYLRYSNGYLKGRASVSFSDGTSSTVYIEMDGTKAYNAGAASVPSPSYSITNGNVSAYDYNGEYVMYVTATFDVDGVSKSYDSWVNVYDAYQAGAASVPSPTIETRLYVRMNDSAYIGGTWVYHTSVWPVTWVNGEEYQWGDEYFVYLTYDAGEGYVS